MTDAKLEARARRLAEAYASRISPVGPEGQDITWAHCRDTFYEGFMAAANLSAAREIVARIEELEGAAKMVCDSCNLSGEPKRLRVVDGKRKLWMHGTLHCLAHGIHARIAQLREGK